MKILFTNNYPMDQARDAWRKKAYPGHHLWGTNELPQYGIRVDIPRHEVFSTINRLGLKWFEVQYLDQQVRVALRSLRYDALYSGCQTNSLMLAVLRSAGFLKIPLVSIVHHPMQVGRRGRAYVAGHDKMICLSRRVLRQATMDFPASADKFVHLDWGPELDFYRADDLDDSRSSCDVISAGKSGRDFTTLALALAETECRVKIFCSVDSAPETRLCGPHTEIIHNHQFGNAIGYSQLVREYRHAKIIAIPLQETSELAGLTSLLDAIAMGKPVVMTRNMNLDIDIEEEGIGIWVSSGDVVGWTKAIQFLLANVQEAEAMGRRARALAEGRYNGQEFGRGLAMLLKSVTN